MKKSKILILGMLVTSVMSLASCGEKIDNGSESSASAVKGNNEANTVHFWHTFGDKAEKNLETLAESFSKAIKEKYGVDVTIECEYQGGYDDVLNKVKQSFSAATTPTIAIAYPDHVAEYMEQEGSSYQYTVDLTPYMTNAEYGFGKQSYLGDSTENDENDFVEAFFEEGKSYKKDGIYSLSFMKSSEALFYNEDMAITAYRAYKNDNTISTEALKTALGTMSWDEFMTFGKYIADNKNAIYGSSLDKDFLAPIFYDSDANLMISKFYQNKIGYSSMNNSGEASIDFVSGDNRTKAEALLTSIKENWENGVLTTKGITGQYGSNYFKLQQCIFDVSSTGGTGYTLPSGDSFTVQCVKAPASNNNPLYISQGPTLTLLRNSGLTDEVNNSRLKWAWMFAKYITNPDNNVRSCIYGSEGYIPVRYSAYDTDAFLEYMSGGEVYAKSASVLINDINGKYINTPVFKGSATLRDQIGNTISSVCKTSSTASVTDAITTAINNTLTAMV